MPQSWSPGTWGALAAGIVLAQTWGVLASWGSAVLVQPRHTTLHPSQAEQQCPAQDIKRESLGLKREMY